MSHDSTELSIDSLNDISVSSWEANSVFWDNFMGSEGNDFFNVLEMPAVERFAAVEKGDYVLDLATGNGLLARRLANSGGNVKVTDVSRSMIELAAKRTIKEEASRIIYGLLDVTQDADFDTAIEEAFKVLQLAGSIFGCKSVDIKIT